MFFYTCVDLLLFLLHRLLILKASDSINSSAAERVFLLSSWEDSSRSWCYLEREATGPAGPGSDPAAAGAMSEAGPAAAEPSGPVKEDLPVSGRFQHHHSALLPQGRVQHNP